MELEGYGPKNPALYGPLRPWKDPARMKGAADSPVAESLPAAPAYASTPRR
jgi:hypothetical protein